MSVNMKDEDLVKEQMKTIGKLQDKIKLLQFDNSRNLELINKLKYLLKNRNKIIKKTKEELIIMKNQNNYEDMGKLIKYLRSSEDEE